MCDMSLSLWFNRFDFCADPARCIRRASVGLTIHIQMYILFAQLFLVDNLIKLFIVDIYHVIKHATLSVYNKTCMEKNQRKKNTHKNNAICGIAFEVNTILSFFSGIFFVSLHDSFCY